MRSHLEAVLWCRIHVIRWIGGKRGWWSSSRSRRTFRSRKRLGSGRWFESSGHRVGLSLLFRVRRGVGHFVRGVLIEGATVVELLVKLGEMYVVSYGTVGDDCR